MKVHKFDSTGDAYDACQCDEEIKKGDLLVIESEKVIGIADTWPVAVTTESGELHSVEPGYALEEVLPDELKASVAEACKLMRVKGWN